MSHYETVCKQCFAVLSNPAFDESYEIATSCKQKGCPARAAMGLPDLSTRRVKRKVVYPKKTFKYTVEITVDGKNIAGSEYDAIKEYYQTPRNVKRVLIDGIDGCDQEFRDIDPTRAVKIKVRQTR